ncbi:MAG: hypothetical protein GY870_07395 [archaeon]|nr:hypothetical protein [archaeon]
MRPIKYSAEPLIEAFKLNLILSYNSISAILGTTSKMTVLRKLKILDYCTSYSHAGSYYIVKRFIPFDEYGLWSKDSIYFSKVGSLMQTIPALVKTSLNGYFAVELKQRLCVKVQNALITLYRKGILHRHQLRGEYLYLCPDLHNDQLRNREQMILETQNSRKKYLPDEISKNIRFLLSILNEQQSRLYLGFESIRFGYGGDIAISSITGVNVKTIARGKKELEQKQCSTDRIRKIGAGRPSLKKN